MFNSGNEFESSRKPRWFVFNDVIDSSKPDLKVGLIFPTFKDFKKAVKLYAIRTRHQEIFGPTTKQKCKAKCKQPGCDWFIWAYLTIPNKN